MNPSQRQLYPVLEQLIRNWSNEGIRCTWGQIKACEAAIRRLREESWEEQALAIFNSLLPLARAQENCWDWLTEELLFEAYAFALDDRSQAALHSLQFGDEITDDRLDRYNQRMHRFIDQSLENDL